jgi:hypothetical protein
MLTVTLMNHNIFFIGKFVLSSSELPFASIPGKTIPSTFANIFPCVCGPNSGIQQFLLIHFMYKLTNMISLILFNNPVYKEIRRIESTSNYGM